METYRIHIPDNGRPSVCLPCLNLVTVKDVILPHHHVPSVQLFGRSCDYSAYDDRVGSDVFQRTRNDDKPSHSIEDNRFLGIMEDRFIRNDNDPVMTVPTMTGLAVTSLSEQGMMTSWVTP